MSPQHTLALAPVILDAGVDILVIQGTLVSAEHVTPRFKDGANGYLLGIHIQSELTHQKLGLGRAAVESLRYPIVKSKLILGMLWQIATGKVEGKLSGPVGITSEISKSIQNGWVDAFELLALLNVYLALIKSGVPEVVATATISKP